MVWVQAQRCRDGPSPILHPVGLLLMTQSAWLGEVEVQTKLYASRWSHFLFPLLCLLFQKLHPTWCHILLLNSPPKMLISSPVLRMEEFACWKDILGMITFLLQLKSLPDSWICVINSDSGQLVHSSFITYILIFRKLVLWICVCAPVCMYEEHLESKERFAIKKYLLIIGKKKNMQVLSHTFTYFST